VVSDLDAGSSVAFHVCKLRIKAGLVKEARHDIASVVENDGDIDILGGLGDKGTCESIKRDAMCK
jgi:hypothetical protein